MIPTINSKVTKQLIQTPYYTEGPVKDDAGNCYFTSLAGGIIYKIDNTGKPEKWACSPCPNGQVILPGGDHLVCDVKLSALSRFSADGHFLGNEMHGVCAGVDILCPNDLIVDAAGGIYFTDSIRDEGKVVYIGTDGKAHILADKLDYPNGLALSNDGKFLFVAESYKNRILIFSLKVGVDTSNSFEVFARLPEHESGDESKNLPDGIKVDKYGNLWVAHYGMGAIQVLDQKGTLIQTFQTDLPLISNLCLTENDVMVTGGYAEPGPGAVLKIYFNYEEH